MSDDKEIRAQITNVAMLQFTDAEIATLVGMALDDLTAQYEAEIDKGRLRAEAQVRQAIYKLAREGNPAAQKQFLELNRIAKRANR